METTPPVKSPGKVPEPPSVAEASITTHPSPTNQGSSSSRQETDEPKAKRARHDSHDSTGSDTQEKPAKQQLQQHLDKKRF